MLITFEMGIEEEFEERRDHEASIRAAPCVRRRGVSAGERSVFAVGLSKRKRKISLAPWVKWKEGNTRARFPEIFGRWEGSGGGRIVGAFYRSSVLGRSD